MSKRDFLGSAALLAALFAATRWAERGDEEVEGPTPQEQARDAYRQGFDGLEVTLEVLEPTYLQTLDDITSIGWRLDRTFEHPRVKKTKVTPRRWDGGHDVVRTSSQQTTFYFVREQAQSRVSSSQQGFKPPRPSQPSQPSQRAQPSGATWAPGWYETEHGWLWWNGAGWGPSGQASSDQPWPAERAGGSRPLGLTTRAHAIHLVLTLFTGGLWIPVWIWKARRSRGAQS